VELAIRFLLLAASAFGFFYGLLRMTRKGMVLFKLLIVFALGCMMLGRLYDVVILLIRGSINQNFNIGMLDTVGAFGFLFTASYGQMDGLADDRTPKFRKYRLIALIAPAVIFFRGIFVVIEAESVVFKIASAAEIYFLGRAAYGNMKHLIIPDVELGIIDCIRGYNLMALLLEVVYGYSLLFGVEEMTVGWIISNILLSVIYAAIYPVLERGTDKWTI